MLTLAAAVLLPWTAAALRVAGVRRVAPRGMAAPRGVRLDAPRAAAIAAAVHRAGRLWRSSCLTRAVTMARLLSREGLDARLTIGVSSEPFAAHAWLEHGAIVLAGDAPARAYAPLCRIDAGAAPAFVPLP